MMHDGLRPLAKRFRHSLIAVLVAASFAGCGAVQPEPFAAFAESNRHVQTGADESIEVVYQWTRERFVAETAAGDADKVQALLLDSKEDDPFGWTTVAPMLPLQVLAFRAAVNDLNDSFVGYADALHLLASDQVASTEEFDKLATDLNANTRSAVGALNLDEDISNKDVAIFSVVAIESFRAYIEHERRTKLAEALRENQATVTEVASFGQDATEILARALRSEYDTRSGKLALKLAPDSGLSASAKQEVVENLLTLNEEYVRHLDLLKTLHQAYGTFPSAHAELAKAVTEPDSGLGQIKAFYAEGRRLERLYKELKGDDEDSDENDADEEHADESSNND